MKKIKDFMMSIDWKNVKKSTYVSAAMAVIFGINYVLTAAGQPIIEISNDKVELIVSIVLALVFSVAPMWKNNSFTKIAILGDKVINALRDGKLSIEEVEALIDKANELVDEE